LRVFSPLVIACTVLALTGCGGGGRRRAKRRRPLQRADHQDFGDFEVHYNALRTDQLAPDVARAYGIERSATG